MKTSLVCLLLGGVLLGSPHPFALGQAADKILYGGTNVLIGVGRYNSVNFGAGLSGRLQYPYSPKVALTAKLGLDVYRNSYAYVLPSSYLGYGYNAITGFGFNTIYYNYYGYEYKGTGVSIPVQFGPRVYLTREVHADLNVGVDIAAGRNMVSVLHVEPGFGYTRRLGNGGYLDLNAGYFTSFARGSGVFTLGAAYGIRLNR